MRELEGSREARKKGLIFFSGGRRRNMDSGREGGSATPMVSACSHEADCFFFFSVTKELARRIQGEREIVATLASPP